MLSKLRRAGRVERKTLSALRPADGRAGVFLLRLLGWLVVDRGSFDCLHFLHGVSAVEPDALRNVVEEFANSTAGRRIRWRLSSQNRHAMQRCEMFSCCLKSAAAYDVRHVRRSPVKGRGAHGALCPFTCTVNLHEQSPRRTPRSRRVWMVWKMLVGLANK